MTKKVKCRVFLVEDIAHAPGRIYAVFAEEEAAKDFRDHYHLNRAIVVPRSLLHGQHVCGPKGYIE